MDGINPTLAFAALFFGLSGHPHDRAEGALNSAQPEQVYAADHQAWSDNPCLDLASLADGVDLVGSPFERDAALAMAALGTPIRIAEIDDQLDGESQAPFEDSIVVFDESAGAGGCGAPAPHQ